MYGIKKYDSLGVKNKIEKKVKGSIWEILLPILFTIVSFTVSYFTVEVNHYLSGLVLMISAVLLYCYFIWIADRNYMDYKALFSCFWIFTIGLAVLQLSQYQISWCPKTWIYLCLCYVVFITGLFFGNLFFYSIEQRCNLHRFKMFNDEGLFPLCLKKERLFWICLIVSLISLSCFCYNVSVKGFIPFFSDSQSAYIDFHTKYSAFMHAGTIVSGLCYYCIKKLDLSVAKKTIMVLCIAYLVFIMPTLIVSRGIFITSSLSFTVAVFFLNKKRFIVLLLCFIFIFGGYEIGSLARNLSDDYLNTVMEPKEIIISNEQEEQEENAEYNNTILKMPAKVAFLYSYLTVGHDNFDQAVRQSKRYSLGALQLVPFNIILKSSWIESKIENAEERYQIRPTFTTVNLFGDAYYDFHVWGIIILALLWGFPFGMIESYFLKFQGPFSMLALGNTLTPIILCFFESWMGTFSLWTQWGTVFLLFLVGCFSFNIKHKSLKGL